MFLNNFEPCSILTQFYSSHDPIHRSDKNIVTQNLPFTFTTLGNNKKRLYSIVSFKASTEDWTSRYKGYRKDVESNKSTTKNVHNTCIDLQKLQQMNAFSREDFSFSNQFHGTLL